MFNICSESETCTTSTGGRGTTDNDVYLPHLNDMIALAKADVEHSPSFVEPSPVCPEGSEQRPLPSYLLRTVQDHVMFPVNFRATFT